jgi:hypothetical protein
MNKKAAFDRDRAAPSSPASAANRIIREQPNHSSPKEAKTFATKSALLAHSRIGRMSAVGESGSANADEGFGF